MKKLLSGILALMLGLSMISSALAEDSIVPTHTNVNRFTYVRQMITLGDAVYLLCNEGTSASLYRWQEGMTQAEVFASDLYYANFYLNSEDVGRAMAEKGHEGDPKYAISNIFTDGETLYGFNGLENLIFTIEKNEDRVQYADVTTVPAGVLENGRKPQSVFRMGKWLIWQDWDPQGKASSLRLLMFNLDAGTVKQAVLPGLKVTLPYKDGKILAISDPMGVSGKAGLHAVYSYDPENDTRDLLGYLPDSVDSNEVDYHAELDRIIYTESTLVQGWSPEKGETQMGFVPTTYTGEIAVVGSSLLYRDNESTVGTTAIREGFTTEHSLTILDHRLPTALELFHAKHPDVPYYFLYNKDVPDDISAEELLTMGSGAPDIVSYTYSKGDYTKMAESGNLLDLSVYPQIKYYVDKLYPLYQEAAMEGDAIYGVPITAYGYDGWFINKEVMKDMGLTAEEIPTSLTELCAFATRWNEAFADKYPQYTLLNNTVNYRKRLLDDILARWSDYCQFTGKSLDASDPVLLEALAALDAAKLDKLDANLKQTDPEKSEYKQALIWTGVKAVGNWGTYMEEFSDRIFIPLTLTNDTPYTAAVQTLVMLSVNANTKNADYAAELLAYQIGVNDRAYDAVLRTDCTEPFISDYHAGILKSDQEYIDNLKASLPESVHPEAIEKQIKELEADMERRKIENYTVTPSAIENYVNVIQPGSFISTPDVFSSELTELLYTAILDYANGTIDRDKFLEILETDLTTERTPDTVVIPVGGFG